MKTAVITGSAGGLGKEFAQRLLNSGTYRVCLSDVNRKLGEKTCQEFRSQYGQKSVFFIACDVTSLEAVETLYAQALSIFDNTESIDLWVNNAGVMGEKEGWKKCMDINLCGVLNGLHVASAKASTTRPLTVINVASILGLFNAKQPKGWAYNTSKSAVVTATRCMGPSWPYVRILCLCPSVTVTPILQGCTDTEIQEMSKQVGGLMKPSQVADAFEELLAGGQSGDVMAVWVDAPPYYIPDTAMGLFIAFTTCAMMFRFMPGVLTPKALRGPHMLLCAGFSILLMWLLFGQLTIWMG